MRPFMNCHEVGTVVYAKVYVAHRSDYRPCITQRRRSRKTVLATIARWETEQKLVVATATKRPIEYPVFAVDCEVAS